MNKDVKGNCNWKEVSNIKEEDCNRMKNGNGRLAQGDNEVQKIWKEYFEDLYNIDTEEQVSVHLSGFDGIWSGNYFRGEPIRRAEVKVRVGKLKNRKATGGEMIKGGGDKVVDLDMEAL